MLEDFLDIPNVQFFGHYVTLVCPFHESFPVRNSLFVWEDWWKCQSCNKQGNDHNYLLSALNSGSTIVFEQKKFINPWNSWIRNYGSVFGACKKAYQSLKNFPQQKYYLENRGIPTAEIETLKLGYLEGWYTFPIIQKDGSVYGVARKGAGFQDQGNKYVTPKGQDNRRLLYAPGGWSNKADFVFLAFGIVSAISLWLMGKSAYSTLSGTILDPTALEEVRKPIYIVPDFKEEASARKLADSLGWRGRVLNLDYTDKLLDPNDMYIYNKNSLKESLNVKARCI